MTKKNRDIRDILFEEPGPRSRRVILFVTVLSVIALLALFVFVVRQFALNGQLDEKHWSFMLKITTWRFIGEGLLSTMLAALGAMAAAFLLAFLMMLGRLCEFKPLSWLSTALIECSRGIPTLLFIYFFLLGLPKMGIQLSAYWKITLPVAISAAGVVSEILRSGVQSVPKGQREAALALGMTKGRTFLKIIFPQGFRFVVHALIAELVIVLKDTTFAYVVNYADLMQNAKVLISNYDSLVSIYLLAAVIYILINYLLNRLAVRIGNSSREGTVNTNRGRIPG